MVYMSKAAKRQMRREKILSAAAAQFFAHGFRSVDLGEFAASLGMSKRTLYQEFPSKSALIEAVLKARVAAISAELNQLERRLLPAFDQEFKALVAIIEKHLAQIKPAFFRDLGKFHPELFEILIKSWREMIPRFLGRRIDRGKAEGSIRADMPTNLLTELFLSLADIIVIPEKMAQLKLSPDAAYSAILSIVFHGVMAPSKEAAL